MSEQRVIAKINPNARVRVRLLPPGIEILRAEAAKLSGNSCGRISRNYLETFRSQLSGNVDEIFTCELHQVMYYFGHAMGMGAAPPFSMCIEVLEPGPFDSELVELIPEP